MARLFAAQKIRVMPFGPASKMRSKIVEDDGFQRPFQRPSNDLPTPSNGVCAHTPHTPRPLEAGKRRWKTPPVPTGKKERI
jgi:hypothetical protein